MAGHGTGSPYDSPDRSSRLVSAVEVVVFRSAHEATPIPIVDENAHTPEPMTLVVEAGPDSRRSITVPAGRHVLGRGRRAAICIADPLLELHHAVVDNAVPRRFVQLAGGAPWTLERAGQRRRGRDQDALVTDDVITVGSSRLRLVSLTAAGDHPPANVTHGAVGALAVSLGWPVDDRVRGIAVALADPLIGCGVGGVGGVRGVGAASDAIAEAPVTLALAQHRRLALTGDGATAVARAVIRQLVTAPERPAIVVAASDVGAWRWVEALDRVTLLDADGGPDVVCRVVDRWRHVIGVARELVLVTDRAPLAAVGSAVRRAIGDAGVTVLLGAPTGWEHGHRDGWDAVADVGVRGIGELRLHDRTGYRLHYAGMAPA